MLDARHGVVERMLEDAAVGPDAYVVLPELGDTGFSFNLDAIVDEATVAWAASLASRLGIWLQPGFAERATDGKGRNCAAIVAPDGGVLGVYRKVHPFSYGKEAQHYGGGDALVIRECNGARICPLICYDLRFPELWRAAPRSGAEVLAIGAGWPDVRQAHWRALLIARAIENQAFVVAVNRVGKDPSLSYAGGSIIVGPTGEILAEAGREPVVLTAEIDLDALRGWRADFPALRDIRPDLLGSIRVDESSPRQ